MQGPGHGYGLVAHSGYEGFHWFRLFTRRQPQSHRDTEVAKTGGLDVVSRRSKRNRVLGQRRWVEPYGYFYSVCHRCQNRSATLVRSSWQSSLVEPHCSQRQSLHVGCTEPEHDLRLWFRDSWTSAAGTADELGGHGSIEQSDRPELDGFHNLRCHLHRDA